MNDQNLFPSSSTRRPVSEGAEKWIGKKIKCLDYGFVYLVDYQGNDDSIAQAARVSYGAGTKRATENEGLIRYLRRHLHTTPFEMVDLKFHAKMPIFVARQWVRHRTASINEYSARYSILSDEFYLVDPKNLAAQSKSNRQGRENVISDKESEKIREKISELSKKEYELYLWLLNDDGQGNYNDPKRSGVARELARGVLGTNFYTQWYWKVNLHNLMHFSLLRQDPHAQYEIRVFADAMAKIAKAAFPVAWQAFEDYEQNAKRFTKIEMEALIRLFKAKKINFSDEEILAVVEKLGLANKREIGELKEKLKF